MQRFGIALQSANTLTRTETLDLVRRAEELGFDSAWAGESWGFDAFTTLTEIAVHTSRIRIGTHIATVFSRTPSMLAQSAASLDAISEGRLILGIGTSGPIVVRNWHGQEWYRPVRRLREVVEIVRLALAGERVTYDGELFQLKGFRMRAEPHRPSVPIMIASLAKASVVQTGEIADGWLPIFPTASSIAQGRAWLAEGASQSGRVAGDVEVAPTILTLVSDDASDARAQARAHIAFYVGGMGTFYHDLVSRQGFPEEADAIRDAWAPPDRQGREAAAAAVSDAMLEAMTLVGEPREVAERLGAFREAGVTLPILMFPYGASRAAIEQTLSAVAAF